MLNFTMSAGVGGAAISFEERLRCLSVGVRDLGLGRFRSGWHRRRRHNCHGPVVYVRLNAGLALAKV